MKLPKNIRQIGEVEEGKRVYVEDYVMTYVRRLPEMGDGDYKAAVLLGQAEWHNNSRYLFISGAVEIQGFRMESETVFSNETWSDVYDKIKMYFNEVEVVGWVFAKPGQEFRIDDRLRKIHLDNFSGQDKVFMIYDSAEKEEGFFIFAGNHFKRLKGYYIYYEKNEGMQSFMVEGKQTKTSENEEEEQAVKDIRMKISNRKEEQNTKKYSQYMYATGTVVAAIILIIGTSMLNSQSKMKDLEDTLNVISDNLSTPTSGEGVEDSKVTVETLNGDVEKKEEEWVEATELPQTEDIQSEDTQVGEPQAEEAQAEDPQAEDPQAEEAQAYDPQADDTQAEASQTETQQPEVTQEESPSEEGNKTKKKNKDTAKKKEGTNQETNTESYEFYIVKKGDTLSQISENIFKSIRYVDQIKSINHLNSEDVIYEGQKLMMPKAE